MMNNSMLASFVGFIAVATAIGCAPVDNVIGEENVTSVGGHTVGGDGVGGAKGGTSARAFGGTTAMPFGGSTSTSGSSAVCDAYKKPTATHSVEVVVRNERSAPVYLLSGDGGLCSNGESMSIYDGGGNRLSQAANCECEVMMKMGGCPTAKCAYPTLLRIEPGSSMTLTWDGTYNTQVNLPQACVPSNVTSLECDRTTVAAGGQFKLVLNGSTDWKCPDSSKCSCDAINGCRANDDMTRAGTLLEPSVTFDWASTNSVTVAFTEGMENP